MNDGIEVKTNPWIFFLLAIGISWFFWFWVILAHWNVFTFPAILFGALGLFGPAFAEIILIYLSNDEQQWRDYWQRVFDVKRISIRWHLVIWLTFPVLNAFSILISVLKGSSIPSFKVANELATQPWRIIPFVIFMLLYGPLPEELGWRGYALDGLQVRYSAFIASIILGFVWSLWHIPLFFMKGTFQHDQLKFGTEDFWVYILGPIIVSILFTWVYNNTHRSTLSAICLHFMINFTSEIIPLTHQARFYNLILVTVVAIVIIFTYGYKTLTFQQKELKPIS